MRRFSKPFKPECRRGCFNWQSYGRRSGNCNTRIPFSLAEEVQIQGWGTMKQPHHLRPREKPISSRFCVPGHLPDPFCYLNMIQFSPKNEIWFSPAPGEHTSNLIKCQACSHFLLYQLSANDLSSAPLMCSCSPFHVCWVSIHWLFDKMEKKRSSCNKFLGPFGESLPDYQ